MNGVRFSWFIIVMLLVGCTTLDSKNPLLDDQGVDDETRKKAQIYMELGVAYMQKQAYKIALENFNKSLEFDPYYAQAYESRAILYGEKLAQNDLALENYQLALKYAPEEGRIHNNYGRLLCRLKKYEEAETEFMIAARHPLYQRAYLAYLNAGLCAKEADDKIKAEQYLREALQRHPKFAIALKEMALLSLENRDYLSARAYLQRYSALAKHTAQTLKIGIETEYFLNDLNQMNHYVSLLRQQFPDSKEVMWLRDFQRNPRPQTYTINTTPTKVNSMAVQVKPDLEPEVKQVPQVVQAKVLTSTVVKQPTPQAIPSIPNKKVESIIKLRQLDSPLIKSSPKVQAITTTSVESKSTVSSTVDDVSVINDSVDDNNLESEAGAVAGEVESSNKTVEEMETGVSEPKVIPTIVRPEPKPQPKPGRKPRTVEEYLQQQQDQNNQPYQPLFRPML